MNAVVALFRIPLVALWFLVTAQSWSYTAVEHFDYPNGTDLQGQSGGTGWTGAWSSDPDGTYVVTSPGLTYPGITSAGGYAVITPAANNPATSTLYRQLQQPFTNNDTFYLGFLAQRTSADVTSRYFGVALFNGGAERILVGQGSGYSTWTISQVNVGPGTNTLVSSFSSQELSYLLLKVAMNASGFETLTFWVNPNFSLTEEENTPVGGTSFDSTGEWFSITQIRIGGGGPGVGGNPSPHLLDEIMLTTESPFAIPEPSSVALVLSGMALFLAARLRRVQR